jgi:hypothetical protein
MGKLSKSSSLPNRLLHQPGTHWLETPDLLLVGYTLVYDFHMFWSSWMVLFEHERRTNDKH